jgi:hypothetical protein
MNSFFCSLFFPFDKFGFVENLFPFVILWRKNKHFFIRALGCTIPSWIIAIWCGISRGQWLLRRGGQYRKRKKNDTRNKGQNRGSSRSVKKWFQTITCAVDINGILHIVVFTNKPSIDLYEDSVQFTECTCMSYTTSYAISVDSGCAMSKIFRRTCFLVRTKTIWV